MAPGTQLLCFLFLLLQFFPVVVFLRLLQGDMVDYKAVVQKHFFGSTGRALLGPLAGFFEDGMDGMDWQRCSDAGDWPTLEHTPSDPLQDLGWHWGRIV